MPRYHFNIHDGAFVPDRKGTDLPDISTARQEAIRYAGRVLDDEATRLGFGEDWTMEVTDETGLVLLRLDFHVTASPVLSEAGCQAADGRT